jgi:hypothetical protein
VLCRCWHQGRHLHVLMSSRDFQSVSSTPSSRSRSISA